MRIVIEPRRPTTLIADPPRDALIGSVSVTAFGLFALIGAINTFLTQPPQYRVYAVILLLLGIPSLMIGLLALSRRNRFVFDTASETLVIERSGLTGTRRTSHVLDMIDAVVLVRFWYLNRAGVTDREYWYRLQLRTAADTRIEVARKLRHAVACEAADAIGGHLEIPVLEEHGRAEGVVAGR